MMKYDNSLKARTERAAKFGKTPTKKTNTTKPKLRIKPKVSGKKFGINAEIKF